MKLLLLLLALLVTFYLFYLLSKLWRLSKRKAQLQRAVFKGRQMSSGRIKKRRERFSTSRSDGLKGESQGWDE
ncbi:hypothetical protein BIY29_10775 [Brenneria alni]|uniref:High mobility group protein Z n=1 Tax=Brenneria alni TaxID=71656 RepID=A0A421DN14_9GAMM|nr:hypothetical protein [Brenneria alni]RLM23212.1 hypothetical protein BIY29_10775 [Brenneria alni]